MVKYPNLKEKLFIQQQFNKIKLVWDNKFKNEIKHLKSVLVGKLISRRPFMCERCLFFLPRIPCVLVIAILQLLHFLKW
jgi:hypothetical protein